MKVKLELQGKATLTKNLDEAEALALFAKLAIDMIENDPSLPVLEKEVVVEELPKDTLIGTPTEKKEAKKIKPAVVKELEKKIEAKGFLLMECPECHEVNFFFAKEPASSFKCYGCNCHSDIESKLKVIEATCDCGTNFWYQTNMDMKMMDVECLNCKKPITVEYNESLGKYTQVN